MSESRLSRELESQLSGIVEKLEVLENSLSRGESQKGVFEHGIDDSLKVFPGSRIRGGSQKVDSLNEDGGSQNELSQNEENNIDKGDFQNEDGDQNEKSQNEIFQKESLQSKDNITRKEYQNEDSGSQKGSLRSNDNITRGENSDFQKGSLRNEDSFKEKISQSILQEKEEMISPTEMEKNLDKKEEACICECECNPEKSSPDCDPCEGIEDQCKCGCLEKSATCKCGCRPEEITVFEKMEILRNLPLPGVPIIHKIHEPEPGPSNVRICATCKRIKVDKKSSRDPESSGKRRKAKPCRIKKAATFCEDPRVKNMFQTLRKRRQEFPGGRVTLPPPTPVTDKFLNHLAKFMKMIIACYVSLNILGNVEKARLSFFELLIRAVQIFKEYVDLIEKSFYKIGEGLNQTRTSLVNGLWNFINYCHDAVCSANVCQIPKTGSKISRVSVSRRYVPKKIAYKTIHRKKLMKRSPQKRVRSTQNFDLTVHQSLVSNFASNIKHVLYKKNYEMSTEFQNCEGSDSQVLSNVADIFTFANFSVNNLNFDCIYKVLKILKKKTAYPRPQLQSLYDSEDGEDSDYQIQLNVKQLSGYLLVSWSLPSNLDDIAGYTIFLDDVQVRTVHNKCRTNALIGPIDTQTPPTKVTLCTMPLGQD